MKKKFTLLEHAMPQIKGVKTTCLGSSTFSKVYTDENCRLRVSVLVDQVCHANLFKDRGPGQLRANNVTGINQIFLHTSPYDKKTPLEYAYFRWLLKESPLRNVYKRTSIRKAMELGLEVKVNKYTRDQILCAAIATRYTHEWNDRLPLFTSLYKEYKHLGVSQTAVWLLLANVDPKSLDRNGFINVCKSQGNHDIVHGNLCLVDFTSNLELGTPVVKHKSHCARDGYYGGCNVNSITSVLGNVESHHRDTRLITVIEKHAINRGTDVWNAYKYLTRKGALEALKEIQSILDK